MDWGLVISGVLGLLAGGSASWLFKIREDKAGAKVDVVEQSTGVIQKVMVLLDTQQEKLNSMITQKDHMIEQQAKLIEEYKCSLEEANRKLNEANRKISQFEYLAKENERKLSGMQKIIDTEVSKKKFAEDRICFTEDCELRKPPKNTYGKESA